MLPPSAKSSVAWREVFAYKMDHLINYDKCENIARKIMRNGFGVNAASRVVNNKAAQKIGLEEMTQLCAISVWRSEIEERNFYSILASEMYKCFSFQSVKNDREQLYEDFHTQEKTVFTYTDWKKDRRIRQIRCLYHALGYQNFKKYIPCNIPNGTLSKMLWKAFGKRKNAERLGKNKRRIILETLNQNGRIRLSATSSSIYIENNEQKIRISDHETESKEKFKLNLIIPL